MEFPQMSKKLQNKRIPLKTRVFLMNMLVRPILTYGLENMPLMQIQTQKLDSTYIHFLRRMVKGGFRRIENTYKLVLTNEKLLQICQTVNLQEFVLKRQTSFIAHQIRRNNDHMVKQLMFNVESKIGRGRPSHTLIEKIVSNLQISRDRFYEFCLLRKYPNAK